MKNNLASSSALDNASIVTLFDTSIGTRNLGDHIIMDAIRRELDALLPRSHVIAIPSHLRNGLSSYKLIRKSALSLVGGTNLLSSNMNRYNQWNINFVDAAFLRDAVLMGVGWWQYQKKPNVYSRALYRAVLSRRFTHSVRDSYAKQQLGLAGVQNVLNTGCPTMWGMTEEFCRQIPTGKAENAVLTLTDYRRNFASDKALIEILQKKYRNVFFWPQGLNDQAYLAGLNCPEVQVIPPSLAAYDRLLTSNIELEFVGTRLHAGIRALQLGRRALIVGVDNRAREIAKNTGLPVVDRGDLSDLSSIIDGARKTTVQMPWADIDDWRSKIHLSLH